MKIKFNWGTGIFLFILLFLAVNGFVIYKSLQQKNDLVTSEYYPEGLAYQKQIERMSNYNALQGKIAINAANDQLVISYPGEMKDKSVKGSFQLFRPSDEKLDITDTIQPDTGLMQKIPLEKFRKGKYIAKFIWTMDKKEYACETPFFIP